MALIVITLLDEGDDGNVDISMLCEPMIPMAGGELDIENSTPAQLTAAHIMARLAKEELAN